MIALMQFWKREREREREKRNEKSIHTQTQQAGKKKLDFFFFFLFSRLESFVESFDSTRKAAPQTTKQKKYI